MIRPESKIGVSIIASCKVCAWSVRPALTAAGAEDEEYEGTEDVDSCYQKENVLPRWSRRLLGRQGAHNNWSGYCTKAGHSVHHAHDLPGVERGEIQLVGNNTVEYNTDAHQKKKENRHRESTIAADKPEQNQETVG